MGAILILLIGFAVNAADFVRPFAVYKVSYNETEFVAGVVGSAFFISESEAISAYHVVNKNLFSTKLRNGKTKIYLLNENHRPIELSDVSIELNPDKDMSSISFARAQVPQTFVYESTAEISASEVVTSEGYIVGEGQIQLNAEYYPIKYQLPYMSQVGFISLFDTVNVNSKNINLSNVSALRLALPVWVGMSGGPLVQYGKVIAFNSFGLPADKKMKTTAWAIQLAH